MQIVRNKEELISVSNINETCGITWTTPFFAPFKLYYMFAKKSI